ncbi:MAG TPA: SdrD B-like domain-containing protein, partial [Anaerolineales bacterium]|nr:SdrD B-like domain-containing protein [Anaerolineales bacterium]
MISCSMGTLRQGARTALSIFSALALLLSAWPEALPVAQAAGTITGTVYRDFNLNGLRETGEVGVAGVTVSAFDSGGASQGTATTGADGTYALAAGGTGPYRVEFTTIPEPYRPGPNGANNGTTVQFVPDGGASGVDLGVNDPAEYCQSLPFIATTCQSNGDPLGGGSAGDHAAVYTVP